MIYEYLCSEVNHLLEDNFLMGQAPKWIVCPIHRIACDRYYGTAVEVINCDEFRAAYLNTTTHYDDMAPKDKSEVKAIHNATGRIYTGNDVSHLNLTPGMKEIFARKGNFKGAYLIDKEGKK